jgi:O-antigen/teichoic acid export membrane protein
MLKKAVTNSFFTTFGALASAAIGLLFAGQTIRFLGDQRAGFLLTIQSVLGLASSVGGLGFGTAAIRRIAFYHGKGDDENARECLGSVIFLNGAISVVVSLGFVAAFPIVFTWSRIDPALRQDAFLATLMVSASFLAQQLLTSYGIVLIATLRYDILATTGTIFGLLSGGAGLVVLTLNKSMVALAGLTLILTLLQLLVNILLARRLLNARITIKFNLKEIREMFKFGAWAWLTEIGSIFSSSLDKIALTSIMGSAALPYYSMSQRIVSQIHGLLSGQSQFVFPLLASQGDETSNKVMRVEDRLRWFIAYISAILYGIVAVFSLPLFAILVTPEFSKLAMIPILLGCVQGFFVAQSIIPYQTSYAEGNGTPVAVTAFLGGTMIFVSMLLLGPRLGIIGINISQLWVGVTAMIMTAWVLKSRKSWNWTRLVRPLITPTMIFAFLISISLIFGEKAIHFNIVTTALELVSILLISLLGLWIEKNKFEEYACFPTLVSALKIVRSKLAFGKSI